MSNLATRLRAVLTEQSMLDHPFYRAWTQGTLEVERLREYAKQYYHFEAAFPRLLSAIHTRTESPAIRQALLDNLWDEEHGERNHPALWLEFAAALGLSAEEVVNSTPNAETQALLDHYRAAAAEAPVAEALVTLFAYEGQVPEIAWQKIKGLSDHYGFKPDQFEFWSVHLVADIAHSGHEMAAIEEACSDEDGTVRAAQAACTKLLGFLDGCYATAGVR
ncbi:MAG: CADD family putative folate metabolism protein [Dehalococcoidia bacterium]|nr:CADD family putative folate metabolism protein [Dehalococcoidia bacterium]